jgi:hypothetical protein
VLATATIHSDVAVLITGDERASKAGKSAGLEIRLLKGAS